MVNATVPLRIGWVLYPGFAALDVFGPLQALNGLSIYHNMTLSIISADLDPVSADRIIIDGVPQEMPVSPVSPYFAQFVLPTHTFDDAPELDVIMVPGGVGSIDQAISQPVVDWLRGRVYNDPEPSYVLTVCTGSSLLARTGWMEGRNATTNKAAFNWVKSVEHADKVNWIAKARWVVDGNMWTSSGVSAGTDMTLAWIEEVYGRNQSETIRIGLEWNALNQTDDPFADYWGLE